MFPTRNQMIKQFREILGSSPGRSFNNYDEIPDPVDTWGTYATPEPLVKNVRLYIENREHIPTGCNIELHKFTYHKEMYQFTASAELISGSKPSKQVRTERAYLNKRYEIFRWFIVQSTESIKGDPNVVVRDIYQEIKETISNL